MVKLAISNCINEKVQIEHKYFEDFKGETNTYDGIWAASSLLHAKRCDMPTLLREIRNALKIGGVFMLGLKLGDDAIRDELGRMYTFYRVDELQILLQEAKFEWQLEKTGKSVGLDGTEHEWIKIMCFAV